jgi:galactokinase
MKLSKPEEDSNAEPDSVDEDSPKEMVEVDGDQMPVSDAVELYDQELDEVLEMVVDQREMIEEQREAIEELTEAVEILATHQGRIAANTTGGLFKSGYDGTPTLKLDKSRTL